MLAPVTDKVEALACPITVEEAVEINPPKVESPFTVNVEEALTGPDTLRLALTVEEAETVAAPETVSVPPVLISVPMVDE